MKVLRDVPFLPLELLMQILSRLPVKTLMQFTRVSKSWKSLIIDNPTFAKLHLKRSRKSAHILLTLDDIPSDSDDILSDSDDIPSDSDDMETHFISCPMLRFLKEPSSLIGENEFCRLKGSYFVIGSCNGLVCLGQYHCDHPIEELCVLYWNPTTRLSSEKSPTLRMNLPTREFALWGKMNCGFGYDDSHDTYKAVVVFWDREEGKMEIMVHCMGDNFWTKVLSTPGFPHLLEQFNGQFVGGCVNWLALEKLNCPNYDWHNVTLQQLMIVCFDMREEVHEYISLPEGVSELPPFEPYLGVIRSHMCLFHDYKKTHFVVWQMREYGVHESWTRLVNVTYDVLQCDGYRFHSLSMCLSEDCDFLLLAYIMDHKITMYNLRDSSVENIQLRGNKVWLDANSYVQSLVLPYQW